MSAENTIFNSSLAPLRMWPGPFKDVAPLRMIVVICLSLAGCNTTQPSNNKIHVAVPTNFKHFTEFGWLPIVDNFDVSSEVYKSKILAKYVAYDWHSRGGGDVWYSQRALPETEEEARAIVQSNTAELSKPINETLPQSNEALEETAKTIISPPAALFFIATLPITYPIYQYIQKNTSTGAPFPEEAKKARDTLHLEPIKPPPEPNKARFDIRVEDGSGMPVEDAKILVIHSPIRFTAYADSKYRRYLPEKKIDDDYGISDEFAAKLAYFIGSEGAPHIYHTDSTGRLQIDLLTGEKGYRQLPRIMHFLVNKSGFKPQSRSIQVENLASINILNFSMNREHKVTSTLVQELNPWLITRKLEEFVWYLSKKYEDESVWKFQSVKQPLEFERFKEYTMAAYSFAPGYPIVQSAMFYLELENGNQSEAVKYSRFIGNDIYTKAIYRTILDYKLSY